MRIPLTKYGWPQVAIFPAVVLIVMIVFPLATMAFWPSWIIVLIEALLAGVLIWVLTFFRDPYRSVPADKNILLAPADGKVTNIEVVKENDFIASDALRIGIFLSIFDVHINRAPCNVKVEEITYKQGKYKNAMTPQSGRINESNGLGLVRTDSPKERLIVRQISGAVARRIVCKTSEGQNLTAGEKFGMIKFGSRTELYLPARENAKCLVQIGDKVKAGLTPLVKYQ
jgi:phosphatidylserine decarboxylase